MNEERYLTIDRKKVSLGDEKNLLELIRRTGIDLPTFCYHSELSVYGACRLCMVEVAGTGLVPACSTPPAEGMTVSTNTEEARKMRKIIVELLLANHSESCPTCPKSATCQLQSLARRLGISKVRFKKQDRDMPIDTSSPSLVRDPNKCVLCGDCVRVCSEVQSVGAIDFAYRGAQTMVVPSFGKTLDRVECVNCGQCARICPTGALTPRSEVEEVWKALHDPKKTVVAQVAPAVRVALGEMFGIEPGVTTTGQISAALRAIGFDMVFDTSFTADLTVIEESNEFIKRVEANERMPQFTSCCPAWVKFVEQYYPEFISHLSTCRSPQQMFGTLCKEFLSGSSALSREEIVVVSIMPCTAKKFEAKRPEFVGETPDVDHVLTTQELGGMIEEAGLHFRDLEPEAFDMPFGFKTGAGVIFGNSGGVSEAILRYITEHLTEEKRENYQFTSVRGEDGIREATLRVKDRELLLAVVSGLGNARKVIEKIKSGEARYDLVEVMACPGGCIGGAGQPGSKDLTVYKKRTKGIYDNDRMLELHKSQENPYVREMYRTILGEVGSDAAHRLLHTRYKSRKRIADEDVSLSGFNGDATLDVNICVGTSCFLRGSQKLLHAILDYLKVNGREKSVNVSASFCFEKCDRGPTVRVGTLVMERCTAEAVISTIEKQMGAAERQVIANE